MRECLGQSAPALPSNVIEALESYPWPGNVRELQNAVERAAILSRGETPSTSHFMMPGDTSTSQLELSVEREGDVSDEGIKEDGPLTVRSGVTVQEMEKALILETLRATNNNRTLAAKLLGISIRTLRNKLNEYRVEGDAKIVEN